MKTKQHLETSDFDGAASLADVAAKTGATYRTVYRFARRHKLNVPFRPVSTPIRRAIAELTALGGFTAEDVVSKVYSDHGYRPTLGYVQKLLKP